MKKFLEALDLRLIRGGQIFFLLIILVAFFLRLYKINNPIADWHSWRQADTASVSKVFLEDGIDLLLPRYNDLSSTASGYDNIFGWRFVEFPLFNALHVFLFKSSPFLAFDAAGRMVSVFSSLISTVLIFLIGKRFLGTAGGLLASFFFAVLPFNIFFSRVILPESLSVMLVLASLLFFTLWIDKEKFWQIFLSSLFFSLALLVKPHSGFYGIAFLYLALEKLRVRAFLNTRLWIFFSISFIPFFLWRGWMNQFIEGIPFWEWMFNGDNIRFRPSFWWWMFEERLGRMILGIWGVVPFMFGFLFPGKDKFPWFVHAMFLSQVAYFSVLATANVRHDYYQTLSIPPIALALGAGALAIWQLPGFKRLLLNIVLFGSITLGIGFSAYQVKEFYKVNHPEIIIAGQAVQRLTPKDARVIAPYGGDTAFLYQTQRRGWPIATLPIEKMINRLGAQYYVSVNFDNQTREVMEKYQVIEKTDRYVVVRLR